MKYMTVPGTDMNVSRIALGTWRLAEIGQNEVHELISQAAESKINFIDTADIYGGGMAEELLGNEFLKTPSLREKFFIQTKCGIRNGYFDFSKEHITEAVEGSLKRLKVDKIDVLLLHRPDALVEPEEVCEAFSKLQSDGKVRYFGVSNHNPGQIELLQKYLKQKIVFNQLQFSITFDTMVKAGLNVNMENEDAVNRDGGVLDYCRLKDITIQPWSPFQYGFADGCFIGSDKYPELNSVLEELSDKYGQSTSSIALAWILRHPANMQPILGTTKALRVKDVENACEVSLTREEWYRIYKADGNKIP